MGFVEGPSLPEKRVGAVLIDFRAGQEMIQALQNLGIKVFFSCRSDELSAPLCGHPDMMIHHIGENKFVCSPDTFNYFGKTLGPLGAKILIGNSPLSRTYPLDIAYNITRLDGVAFCKQKYTDKTVLTELGRRSVKLIDIAQGYSKCNICVVSTNAIMTSDEGIAKAAVNAGVHVLKISAGHIDLDGFTYGFIGGATGLIAADTLAVSGDISLHPDYKSMADFCGQFNVKLIALTDKKPVDIGSIIPLIY